MTEKQLNLKYLKERYKHPTWEAMLEISSEQYIRGLKQGKFDCEMDQLEKWNELKGWLKERIKSVQEEKEEFEEDLYNNYETNSAEIIIRRCEITQLEDVREQMQELEGTNE